MRRFLLLGLFILLPVLNPAQTRRPMTFEDMMHMKRLGDTAVSPDGAWLAYSVTTVDLRQNTRTAELWLQKIAGGAPQRVAVARPDDDGLQFAPDGKQILFLSGRSGRVQVWLADFDPATGDTSNPRMLTHMATGADNAIWAPDGRSLVFTSFVYPDCPAITEADFDSGNQCNANRDAAAAANPVKAQIFTHLLYRHWNHFTGNKRSHLFLVTVASSSVRDLNPGDTHDTPPFSLEGSNCGCAFSPDSKELAYTEKNVDDPATSTNADIFTLDLTDPSAKARKISTSPGGDFSPAYSPDGKYIAWRSQERAGYESDKFRLVLYDRAVGSRLASQQVSELASQQVSGSAIRVLMPQFDNWVDEFAWDDLDYIYFASGNKGEESLYSIGVKDGDLHKFENIRGQWSDIHVTPPSGHGNEILVAAMMTVDHPTEVYAVDLDKASSERNQYTPRQITHLNDALLAQLDLHGLEAYWFTAQDGTKVQGFVVRPPHFDPAKKYPVKFLIHGGPEGAWGDEWSYRWNAELFAANGYVVVMVNPRGSTGYGQAFVDGVNGDWGGKPFTDLMTGLDYAEQHYPFIDKTRECALGASYGGYMANWVLGHTDRFRCIVSHDGMFNPESAFGSTEELWFNEWEFRGKPWDYFGKPESEDPFRKWSPMLSVKNFKTPTLVVHSQLDYRLDVSEGYQLFTALQLMHVPSKMLYFPDEGHWVLKPQNSQLWWKTVNDWVDEWTKSSR